MEMKPIEKAIAAIAAIVALTCMYIDLSNL